MYKFSLVLLFSAVMVACGPASNQTNNPSGNNLSNAAIDSIIASSKKSCVEELSKQSGAESAEKICGCASTKMGDELKKDPAAAADEKKLADLTPGVISACVKELAGVTAPSPSPSPASGV